MAQQLIYTSAPRGLEPGRTGFCTVAMTRGMSPQMAKILEGLVAYTPVFEHYDQNSASTPPSFFHYPISDGRNRYELLARVCACGLDYTKRSNKIGHFILLSEEEKKLAASGPTSLLLDSKLFMPEWHGEPQYLDMHPLNVQAVGPAKAEGWEKVTGDAGWAAWLADSYMANPTKPCFVVFDPLKHHDLQRLVAESLMLLPEKLRWQVTWNTYMTATVAGLPTCNWRFCIDNPVVKSAIGYVPGPNVLDLTKEQPRYAGNSPLAQCARTGENPYPEMTPIIHLAPISPTMQSAAPTGDGLSLAALRKRQEEQKAALAKPELRLKKWDEDASSTSAKTPVCVPGMNGGNPSNWEYMANGGMPLNGAPKKKVWLVGGIIGGIAALLLIVASLIGILHFRKDNVPERNVTYHIKGDGKIAHGKNEKYTLMKSDSDVNVTWSFKGNQSEDEAGVSLSKEEGTSELEESVVVTNRNPDSKQKKVILMAKSGGKELATLEITLDGKPTVKEIEIVGPDKFEYGQEASFTCMVELSNGKKEKVDKVMWSLAPEDNDASVNDNGVVKNTNTTENSKTVVLKASYEGNEDTRPITLDYKKEVKSIEIKEASDGNILLSYSQSRKFTAVLKDTKGKIIEDKTINQNVYWEILEGKTYEKYYSLTPNGGEVKNNNPEEDDKEVTLRAKYDDLKSSDYIKITLEGRTLESIEIKSKEEDKGESIPSGEKVGYKCIAHWKGGSTEEVSAQWSLSVEDEKFASIDKETGMLTNKNATEEDHHITVIAKYGGESCTKNEVTLFRKELKSIKIIGDDSIPFGGTRKYRCKATWSYGEDSDVDADWHLDGKKKNYVKEKEFSIPNTNKQENKKTITLQAIYEDKYKSQIMKITLEAPNIEALKGKLNNLKREFGELKTKIEGLEYPAKKNLIVNQKKFYDINKKNFDREKDEKLANLRSIMDKDPVYKEEPTPHNCLTINNRIGFWSEEKNNLKTWYNDEVEKHRKITTPEK
ncbi:MAG: hypothetical protein IJS08_19635 [Victivallales bacterium]|nr:hypothetical protein [Victivallales bacterium]